MAGSLRCGLLTVFAICVLVVLTGMAGYSLQSGSPTVDSVLAQQRSYFAMIRSLEFCSNETITFSEEARIASKGKTPKILHNDMRFAAAGPLYRSEVDAYEEDPNQATTFISLYNAVDRKKFVRFPGKDIQQASAPDGDDYCGANVLVGVFDFALRKGDAHSLKPLQAESKWKNISASITSAYDDSVMNHDGVTLTMTHLPMCGGSEQVSTTVFFASDNNYFPLYWKSVNPDGSYRECKVTDTKSISLGDGITVVFPIRVESSFYVADKLWSHSVIQVKPDSLKVNSDIDPKIFSDHNYRVGVFVRSSKA